MNKPYILNLLTVIMPEQEATTVLSERPAVWWAHQGAILCFAQRLGIEEAIAAGFTKTHEGTSLIDQPKDQTDE